MKRKMRKLFGSILAAAILCTEPVTALAISEEAEVSTVSFENADAYGAADFNKSVGKQKNVIFHYSDGSVYKEMKTRNGKVRLPYMANPADYTFLGWSKTPGKTSHPDYEAGDIISLSKNTDLYPVMFDRSKEPDLSKKDMVIPAQYKHIIFVGDSRTYALEQFFNQTYGKSAFKNVDFIGKPGSTLSWLKKTGITKLNKLLEKNKKNGEYEKTAIIFNHGVNDVKHKSGKINVQAITNNICSYMESIAPALQSKNCELYYMSVNPINTGRSNIASLRKGEEVRQLNRGIKERLSGTYSYIDSYNYLVKNGYGTAFRLAYQSKDDGTHYTYKTYKRIFAYCLKMLSKRVN